jgi:hypothetical protein
MAESNRQRPRREMWVALLSGIATGYLGLIGLYLLIQ